MSLWFLLAEPLLLDSAAMHNSAGYGRTLGEAVKLVDLI